MDLCIGGAVAAVAAVLYGMTMARDIVLGDTPELMIAAITLGVAHPPGYPLFAMLGHLFSLLPAGPLPLRLDLLSVVCGVGTVALVYLTALRLSGNRAASACAALVLACTPLFWSWSLVAEVFSLNNLAAAAVIYLLVVWQERPERRGFLIAAAFLSGLGLTNHQTLVLLGPAVLFLLWTRRRQLLARPRIVAACVAAFLVGLLPYAYLPWAAARHPVWNWGDATSLANFLAVILRKHYGTLRGVNAPQYMGGSPLDRIASLGASFGVLAGILLLLGAIQAYRRRRWYFWFTLLAFAFAGPIFVAYLSVNLSAPLTKFVLERFYLLPQVVLAPLMALGVLLAAELLASIVPALRVHAVALLSACVLLAVLGGVIANYAEIDQSKNHAARKFAEDVLASLEPRSILIANGDEVISPVVYLQDVEGYRPDVALVVMPLLRTDWYVPQLRRQYPNLTIPFAQYDGRSGTLKDFIEANPGRPIAVVGVDPDDSLKGSYWYYHRGLVAVVEPISKDVTIDEMMADNEKLFSRYRPPSQHDIKSKSLEPSIVGHYVILAFGAGEQCEQLHYYPQARVWYQRALNLDPSLGQVRDALTRVEQQH
ncbi:MAG TPA: DUF2723 domain-containing protein [Bryobacteraceae bacterium]|nr:DUF2723 domain-containing protein [Bryobacteraceae bacterium]